MFGITYRNYLLALVVLVGVVTNFERFIFSLVLEPLKQELLLSDSQLGLMTGIAFAAFYAIAGIPIARWADRGNRTIITALAVGLSGIMVSLCGTISSFYQLLLVRAGVAVGEAGVVPTAQSLISDYFDRTERPRAMAIYLSFYTISMIVGYLVGGWLVEFYGWRTTFILIGVPGIFMAILVKLTLKEPRLDQPKLAPADSPSLLVTFKVLWQQRTFRQILVVFCLGYFFSTGTTQWLATFLMRSHDMGPSEVGVWLALAFGVFGTVGNYLGGFFCSRYAACKEKLQMRILAFTTITYGITSAVVYLSPNKSVALTFIAIGGVLGALCNGPIFAAIQSLVQKRMRSVAVAIIFLFANLIGFGLGPLVLGVLSDILNPIFEQDSLRYALVLFCPGTIWVAFHYWKVSDTIEADIKSAELQENKMDLGSGTLEIGS